VLATIVMLVLKLNTAAIVAAVLAGAIGLFGLIRRYGASGSGTSLSGGRMLGRGPYSETVSRPDHEFLLKLAHTVDELREAAREGDWVIDWRTFDDFVAQALAADKSKQYVEGVRFFCRAISFMMNELRTQPTR
jgi:hypothetical protein